MADDSLKDKKTKLASTRKRFKELQELKKKKEASASPTTSVERSSISPSQLSTGHENDNNFAQNVQYQNSSTTSHISENCPSQPYHNDNDISESLCNLNTSTEQATISNADLPNYFEAPSSDFFDNVNNPTMSKILVKSQKTREGTHLLTYFDTSQPDNLSENTEQNIGLAKYFDNTSPNFENISAEQFDSQNGKIVNYALFPPEREESYVSEMQHITHPTHVTPDSLSEEDPAIIKDSEMIQQNHPKTLPNIFGAPEETQYLIEYLGSQGAEENINQPVSISENNQVITDATISADYPEVNNLRHHNVIYPSTSTQNLPDCYLNQETLGQSESDEIKDHISRSTDLAKQESQQSNVESLKPLSDPLAQMIDPSYEFSGNGGITDLEKRNLELAANLEKEKINNENLKSLNLEYLFKMNDLDSKLRQQQTSSELQSHQEISRLRDELQTHFQTIGLLVNEKTELAATVNQFELSLKQKIAECDEFQTRLKASRSRVADVERELAHIKEEKSKIENIGGQYSLSYEVIKKEYENLREQKEDLAQDLLETKERLRQSLDQNVMVQQQNKDLNGKLSLAEIKIQQLTSSGDLSTVNAQIEQLTQQKLSLENELVNSNQMLKSFIKERDEARTEYQHYAEQLNAQISNLHTTIEKLQQEKENLINQEQNRIRHIGELERQLQTLQDNQISYATRNTNSSDLKNELESFKEMVVQMQSQKTVTEENYTKVCNEKELLLKELEAKTDSISQLESMVEQLRGNQPDSVKLLATMESDKVAAARAVQQNKDLKLQMESMQEVFAKLDNDKIILTDQLNFEQKTNKELMEKLQKTEIHLQTLAEAIEIKDKELLHLRNTFEEVNRQALQHEQLNDRLRHYEAHDHSAHSLQNELLEAKTTIAKLINELNQLKNIQGNWDNKPNVSKDITHTGDGLDSDQDKDKIVELTNEINRLKAEIANRVESNESVVVTNLENLQINGNLKNIENGENTVHNNDPNQNILDKETTVNFLEDKVKRTMQEIADLTDEKQRLEHIILQLQGETETIGEYVALYQHQRMILKQKALEKDYQLKQLASDREQVKGKLERLNQLIQRLVLENGAIPEELIQHQEIMNNQTTKLCEMHSQINDEVNNKIARDKDVNSDEENLEVNVNSKATKTAEEIITLLSEIKTSNLVEPGDNFHHCPYCSGQLITV